MKTHLEKLNEVYDRFFDELSIDKSTGILADQNKRFATKIAVGDNYLSCKRKILFVSLDIGKDEKFVDSGFKINSYQDFEERKNSVCYQTPMEMNAHIAATYGTTLYFLKDDYNWEQEWKILEESSQFFRGAIKKNWTILPNTLLSNIALVNFYNFVEIGRESRTGASDRELIHRNREISLLIEIINIIKPNVIILQGKSLRGYFTNEIKSKINTATEIFGGYHPSIFGRRIKYQNPKLYIENLLLNRI